MSYPFEPDITDQAILSETVKLTHRMARLREAVGRNDREAVFSGIKKVKLSLLEIRHLLRCVESDVKLIEGAPLKQPGPENP
ncbi:MAG: hypothetical protein J2P37_00355 [Ktedonobacteraceae bacterium]|nr:hypothetical protein [Ktedonobacteraceae bacterium]